MFIFLSHEMVTFTLKMQVFCFFAFHVLQFIIFIIVKWTCFRLKIPRQNAVGLPVAVDGQRWCCPGIASLTSVLENLLLFKSFFFFLRSRILNYFVYFL